MNIIVDTVIWSIVFRRDSQEHNTEIRNSFQSLVIADRVVLMGAIRQEVLSGLRHQDQFDRLRGALRAFPDLPLSTDDYELAADFYNICRRNGIQGSNTDFLICAAAHRRNYEIFTSDRDFEQFQSHIPISLFVV
jgi:predicted nucleic acid-binding protein